MDSGYEVVLVDVNVATTNGLNGTHEEEVTEMKTRSKVAVGGAGEGGDDESAKPKVRLTRTAAVAQKANDKDGSDSEKKDKKKNPRGTGDAEEAAAGLAKPVTKEAANNAGGGTAGAKAAAGGVASAVTASGAFASKAKLGGDEDSSRASSTAAADSSKASVMAAAAAVAATPPSAAGSKKKAQERDDDSGINSRASSVSNDDVATPARMRTRSSRASEISSTSTPAYRRGAAARVPISIYEYDAASFDDDLLPPISAACSSKGAGSSSSLKRKAVVYVEEMEDEESAANSSAEPVAKRRPAFLFSAGAGIVTSLLYPLRKLRNGIAAIRPYKGLASAENTLTAADVTGAEHQKSVEDATVATDESMVTNAQTGSETVAPSSDPQQPGETANTCSLM